MNSNRVYFISVCINIRFLNVLEKVTNVDVGPYLGNLVYDKKAYPLGGKERFFFLFLIVKSVLTYHRVFSENEIAKE